MRTLNPPFIITLGLGAAILLAAGCASIAEDYRIPDGSSHTRGYTSVAGEIRVGRHASIGSARTVAGDIDIRDGSRTGNLTTVAGKVRLAEDVTVDGSIKTVAGNIRIAKGCTITGDVGTVVGHIDITDAAVTGDITLASGGELDLTRTRVTGAVRVKYRDDDHANRAEITIGPDSSVREVIVEKKADVRLRIHRSAKVGAVKGVEAEYYD